MKIALIIICLFFFMLALILVYLTEKAEEDTGSNCNRRLMIRTFFTVVATIAVGITIELSTLVIEELLINDNQVDAIEKETMNGPKEKVIKNIEKEIESIHSLYDSTKINIGK